MRFFRSQLDRLLAPRKLQREGYDHVLREQDRHRGAFEKIVFYILENPVRAGLAPVASAYSFSGVLIPGYPDLDVSSADYWDLFCWLYEAALEKSDWTGE